ncbi:MAG: gamma-glutamylcyclotransferase family protein [Pseudomonadota bacterium]
MKRVFGYGSLVNRRTHDFPAGVGTLSGWQRVWVSLPDRPVAILSAEPAPGQIEGLYMDVSAEAQPDLDRREIEYDCLRLEDGSFVYSIPQKSIVPEAKPILRSYLDVVMQGFETELGEASLTRFMATTVGWNLGILDDRATPIYPRAQVLTAEQTARYDDLLASVPVVKELV